MEQRWYASQGKITSIEEWNRPVAQLRHAQFDVQGANAVLEALGLDPFGTTNPRDWKSRDESDDPEESVEETE